MATLDSKLRSGVLSRRQLLLLLGGAAGASFFGSVGAFAGRGHGAGDVDDVVYSNASWEEVRDMGCERGAVVTHFNSAGVPWVFYDGRGRDVRGAPSAVECSLGRRGNSLDDQAFFEGALASESSGFGIVPSGGGSTDVFIRAFLTPGRGSRGEKLYAPGLKVVVKVENSVTGASRKIKGLTAGDFGEAYIPCDAVPFDYDVITVKVKKSSGTSNVVYKYRLNPGTNYVQVGVPQRDFAHPYAGQPEVLKTLGLPADKKVITQADFLDLLRLAIWAREEGDGNKVDSKGNVIYFGNSRFGTYMDDLSRDFRRQDRRKAYRLALMDGFDRGFYNAWRVRLPRVLAGDRIKFKNIEWMNKGEIDEFTRTSIPEGYLIGKFKEGTATYFVDRAEDGRLKGFLFVVDEPGPGENVSVRARGLYERLVFSEGNIGLGSEPASDKEGAALVKRWPIPGIVKGINWDFFDATGWDMPGPFALMAGRFLYDTPLGTGAVIGCYRN